MALSRGRRYEPVNYWPGFVDALSTMLLVIIFLLSVFMLAQFFLSREVTGKDEALTRLNRQIEELTNLLALERTQKGVDESKISTLSATLGSAQREQKQLKDAASRGVVDADAASGQASAAAIVLDQEKQISAQALAQVDVRRRGSCRDFAVLMIEAARALGVAARFVSGYVYVPKGEDEPVRLGGGATHAWCQIYLPGAGWVEFDPTNGLVGSKDLIRVAVARNPSQAAPLTGAYFGAAGDELGMEVTVEVTQPKQIEPSLAVGLGV